MGARRTGEVCRHWNRDLEGCEKILAGRVELESCLSGRRVDFIVNEVCRMAIGRWREDEYIVFSIDHSRTAKLRTLGTIISLG